MMILTLIGYLGRILHMIITDVELNTILEIASDCQVEYGFDFSLGAPI